MDSVAEGRRDPLGLGLCGEAGVFVVGDIDPDYAEGEAPHERGRRPHGRIAIANSDAGARAFVDCAIDQAWRAVGELA